MYFSLFDTHTNLLINPVENQIFSGNNSFLLITSRVFFFLFKFEMTRFIEKSYFPLKYFFWSFFCQRWYSIPGLCHKRDHLHFYLNRSSESYFTYILTSLSPRFIWPNKLDLKLSLEIYLSKYRTKIRLQEIAITNESKKREMMVRVATVKRKMAYMNAIL